MATPFLPLISIWVCLAAGNHASSDRTSSRAGSPIEAKLSRRALAFFFVTDSQICQYILIMQSARAASGRRTPSKGGSPNRVIAESKMEILVPMIR